MYQLLRPMLACLVILHVGTSQVRADGKPIGWLLTEGNDSSAVVAGVVRSVKQPRNPGGCYDATIEIGHVYSGPKTLGGKTFIQCTIEERGLNNQGDEIIPLAKVSETGIWHIYIDETKSEWYVSGHYLQLRTGDFRPRIAWAEAIERMVKMKVGERLNAAKELCKIESSEVAGLGIEVLFGAPEPDAAKAGVPEFIKELPNNPAVSVAALMRADNVQYWDTKRKWRKDPDRKLYFERFKGIVNEDVAQRLINHLGTTAPRDSAVWMEATRVLGAIAANPKQLMNVRMMTLDRLVKEVSLSVENDPPFDILAGIFKSEPDGKLRLQIAQWLAHRPRPNFTFTPGQLAVLRDLEKREKRYDVKGALREACGDDPSEPIAESPETPAPVNPVWWFAAGAGTVVFAILTVSLCWRFISRR